MSLHELFVAIVITSLANAKLRCIQKNDAPEVKDNGAESK
jgi:hypothetical protein